MQDTNSQTPPPYDLHIHTGLSPCAVHDEALSSVMAYAQEAKRRCLEIICITDHFALPADWVPEWYENSGPEIIQRVRKAAAAADTDVEILVGCEAEMVAPGKVTINAQFARELDFVLLAASHFHFNDIGPQRGASPETAAGKMVEYLDAAVRLPFVDAVAHPLVVPNDPFGDPRAYATLITDDQMHRICAAAVAHDVALEINGAAAVHERYRDATRRLFSIARGEGVHFTVGSDAHSVHQMETLDAAWDFAEELGLAREDFLDPTVLLERRQDRG